MSKDYKHSWHQVEPLRREWIYENLLTGIAVAKKNIENSKEHGLLERVAIFEKDLRALEIAYMELRGLETPPSNPEPEQEPGSTTLIRGWQ